MGKNVLFICCEMGKGGVSKSLASLLSCLDYNEFNIDLFLFRKTGLFLEQVPEKVNILAENPRTLEFLKRGRIDLVLCRILTKLLCRNISNLEKKWSLYWKLSKNTFSQNLKKYDVAISYNDGVELYYLIDCVNAKIKIGYNHTDYKNMLTYKPNLDRIYFNKLDYLVSVSEMCANKLKEVFPEVGYKVRVVENIVLKDTLFKMAGEKDPYVEMFFDRKDTKVVCTVAGLWLRKGFDFAAAGMKQMKREGKKFKWVICGVGPEEMEVKHIIEKAGIIQDTIFMYEQSNPYKYVRWADMFVLTSHMEGKSIAIEEAKLLEKPILITRYSSAADQIENGKSGLIAEMNYESVIIEMRKLFENENLTKSLSLYLKNNCHSNKEINLQRLYSLWN